MRSLLAVAAVMSCLSAAAEAKQTTRTIVSDIEMSEWTPPLELAIDLGSGEYSIKPPATQWPSSRPKPGNRSGNVTGSDLVRVRKAFNSAISTGVADRKCVAVNGQGYDAIISNAGVARMTLSVGGKQTTTAATYACWTPAAHALHEELERTFGRRSPT